MCVSEQTNGPRSWHRLKVSVPATLGEEFSVQCFDLGSCGVQYEELGENWSFTVYFDSDKPIDWIRSQLALLVENGTDCPSSRFVTDTEEERDWSIEWRDFLKPVRVSNGIRIAQPWNTEPLQEGGFEIVIEPKMAFGTGGHESTRLCLMALEEAGPAGASCLDVGTGSGVVAIAAVFLGASDVTAIDCDSIAIANARENVALNLGAPIDLQERVEGLEGSVETVAGRHYDMIMANIESQHLYSLLEPIEKLLTVGGLALFSGLMIREEEEFRQRLQAAGLKAVDERQLNGWMSLTTVRA